MEPSSWYLLIGPLALVLVLASGSLRRLPVSTAMVYLAIGWIIGALGWLSIDPQRHAVLLEQLTEIAVIVSLFAAGLKLRRPLRSRLWRLPLWLAFGSMAITVGLVAAAAVWWLGLPLGAAIILGAVLAPTDPVLASDVRVEDPNDTDRLRFTLTGEAGLNDGTAFPLVMLGLGLLGLHDLGEGLWRWWTIDVAWATLAGLGSGALIGGAVARSVVYLRSVRRGAVGYDDFLALGLIATSYGVALAINAYGFLAVFAAGLALRTVEREISGDPKRTEVVSLVAAQEEMATHPRQAPAYMAAAMLHFDEQVERLAELSLMLLTGALLASIPFSFLAVGFALLLFLLIRPVAVAPFALIAGLTPHTAALVSWFGIRGVGSLYYLFLALNSGFPRTHASLLIEVTVWTIALSVVLHGVTVTPLMLRYQAAKQPSTAKSAAKDAARSNARRPRRRRAS
jgi:sodium/hydrogen antiporter